MEPGRGMFAGFASASAGRSTVSEPPSYWAGDRGAVTAAALGRQLVREIQVAYFFCSLLSASFSAVFSASAAFTFTSGLTPVPSQLVFEMGLTTLMPGTRIVK